MKLPLTANPGLKLFALVLAASVWLFETAPRREKLEERAFSVPIALIGIPRETIITTRIQDSISVRLRGPRSTLNSLPSTLQTTLDLSGLRPGDISAPIRAESLSIPDNVEVVTIDPKRVTFRLEALRQGSVPVRPYLVGSLPEDFILGEISALPDRALVSGPASLIRNITEVGTERIILTGRTTSFQNAVGLVSDHPLVRVVLPGTVMVNVEVIPPPPPAEDVTVTDTSSTATDSIGDVVSEATPQ